MKHKMKWVYISSASDRVYGYGYFYTYPQAKTWIDKVCEIYGWTSLITWVNDSRIEWGNSNYIIITEREVNP